jgi:predicted metal-binding membrane protein
MSTASGGISVRVLAGGGRALLLGSIMAVAGTAWLVLATSSLPSGRTAILLPHAHSEGLTAFGVVVLMWFVMMVAMMLPAVTPWLLGFATMTRTNGGGFPYLSVGLFAGGYFAIWLAYSLGGAWLQIGLQQWGFLHPDLRVSAVLGGVLLVAAGLFQMTPLKAACLAHCRNPLTFFLARWQDGPAGAFQMGFRHGVYCLGCCWALMALSFALGVMNLLWMAALTLIICVEKIASGGERMSRALGFVLMAWGVWVLVVGAGVIPWM